MKPSIGITVVPVALAAVLVACGEDKPTVCGSVDSLSQSVESVKKMPSTPPAHLVTQRASRERAGVSVRRGVTRWGVVAAQHAPISLGHCLRVVHPDLSAVVR